MLKISVCLLLFTGIATAFVYAETVSVEFNDDSFDIEYEATGVTVSDVVVDYEMVSLTFAVDVPDSDGVWDVSLERSFFDSVDDDFVVLVDDDITTVREIETTSESRTLRIELPAGSESVEIIGSIFVPSAESDSDSQDDSTKVDADSVDDTAQDTSNDDTSDDVVDNKDVSKDTQDTSIDTLVPVTDMPKKPCGWGTILEDGICVLDDRCGHGTVLKGEKCVLDTTPKPYSVKMYAKELVVAAAMGFAISGILGIILGIFAWAHKVRN